MNTEDIIARVSIEIGVPADQVWEALTTPAIIKKYMFGTDVESDFKRGSKITWTGEWEGKTYQDKGEIIDVQRNELLRFSHFSPLSGEPDLPQNYHYVTIQLVPNGRNTLVTLTQDNNASESAREHSEKNWKMMLEALKRTVERR